MEVRGARQDFNFEAHRRRAAEEARVRHLIRIPFRRSIQWSGASATLAPVVEADDNGRVASRDVKPVLPIVSATDGPRLIILVKGANLAVNSRSKRSAQKENTDICLIESTINLDRK